jgi:membrane-bound lytic murein transglycosylase A
LRSFSSITTKLIILPFFYWFAGCHPPAAPPAPKPLTLDQITQLANQYETDRRGRLQHAESIPEAYCFQDLDTLPIPPLDSLSRLALVRQLKVLESYQQKKIHEVENVYIDLDRYVTVIQTLLDHGHDPLLLKDQLVAYQSWGKDRRGNVKFTGYFTPTLQVRAVPDSLYRFPFYRRPPDWEGPFPTRSEITSQGALAGQGLEIAYAKDPLDIYFTQLQGSGLLEFVDTKDRKLLSYDGSNRHPYISIERFLARHPEWEVRDVSMDGIRRFLRKRPELVDSVLSINPSYAFFNLKSGPLVGAGQVPMEAGLSVAVDKRYYPLGTVLLATIPTYGEDGKFSGHQFRLLFPQDVGGVVRGPGHIDVYEGTGPEGQERARRRYHHGRVWVLLPNPSLPQG